MKLVNNLDFNKYEARSMRLQNLATAPASPVTGQAYFDTALGKPRVWDGSAWDDLGSGNVTQVTATGPITSTGGTAPVIGITAATTGAAGSMSAADKSKLDGIAAGATATTNLDSLTDVTVTSPATGQVIRWSGTAWVNATLAIADTSGLQAALDNKTNIGHNHTQGEIGGLVTALNNKIETSTRGAANGVATLDASGKVPSSQLPALAMTNVTVVADTAARDALTGMSEGDVAIVNGDRSYIWDGTVWQELDSATDGVQSVTAGTGITVSGSATNPTVGITPAGIGAASLSGGIAGDGLNFNQSTGLAVNAGTGLEIVTDNVRIAAAAAGNGLVGGGGSALAVGAGAGISVAADAVAVDTAVVVRKAAANIGDGTSTSYAVTHNLGTRDVTIALYTNAAPYDEVVADYERTDTNTVTVKFAAAPTANQYRVVIHG